jgi:tetratricopeptide (TPR) repeat protein
MPDTNPTRDPLEQLAEEWRERLRRGEQFEADEYVERHPDLADEILDLFPAIVMMEELKPQALDLTGAYTGAAVPAAGPQGLERLGDFRILREVGRGGMGVVYEAEQESLGRRVALKVLPAQALADRSQRVRFQREARATARLHHTNIVPVYGVGEANGMHYYVMQFIQGAPLDQVLGELKRLRQARTSARGRTAAATPPPAPAPTAAGPAPADVARSLVTGTFQLAAPARDLASAPQPSATLTAPGPARPPAPAASDPAAPSLSGPNGQGTLAESGRQFYLGVARIGIQVAEALEYANSQGIVHRDIKPSNLLLDTQATVWVTDFGLAKALTDGENLTHTGDIVGTLRYMAPERFLGQADARGDIYSLGLTLYELLLQQPAFAETDRSRLIHQVTNTEPSPPRKINPAIPRDLETIVLKAMEREPARRYQSAAALAQDLKRFVEDKPIGARRVTSAERLWRWCRRNPALASLAAALLLLLVVMAAGSSLAAIHFQDLAGQEQKARQKADAAFIAAEEAWQSEARQLEEAVKARQAAEAAQAKEAEQRQKAVLAQKAAQDNFLEARRAVDELLVRVSEGKLKNLPGLQPLRKELLESALKYYQGFVDKHGDDPTLKKDLADAYTRVAGILGEVGSRKEALKTYDKVWRLRTELAERDPGNRQLKLDLVAHLQAVGRLQARLGEVDAAERSFNRAYDLLLTISPQDKDNTTTLGILGGVTVNNVPVHVGDPEILLIFAGVLNDQGRALRARNPADAIGAYTQALYIYRKLLADDVPGDKTAFDRGLLEQELARQWSNIGQLYTDLGMYHAAFLYQQEAMKSLRALVSVKPPHPQRDGFQRDLAAVLESAGEVQAARNQNLAGLNLYRQALVIRQQRARDNPAVADCQAELAHCQWKLALMQARNKQLVDAQDSLVKAAMAQNALAATFPEEKAFLRVLARQWLDLARLYQQGGKEVPAKAAYRSAYGALERSLLRPESPVGLAGVTAPLPAPPALPALQAASLWHVELSAAEAADWLDLARARAGAGDTAQALAALRAAVRAGFQDAALLQAAPEFAALQSDADFQAVARDVKAGAPTLAWVTDVEKAKAQAAREGKDLFLYFNGSDWAPHAVAFRNAMLRDSKVVAYLAQHFVAVDLDRRMYTVQAPNYPQAYPLLIKWQISNFGTMVLADPKGRAYLKTDKGSSEVASWVSAQEFIDHLEACRQKRIARDKGLAEAAQATDDLDRARLMLQALEAVPIYAAGDYQEIFSQLFALDRDDKLAVRPRFFHQVLAARKVAIRALLDRRDWSKALEALNDLLDEPLLTGKARRDAYLDRGFAYVGLGRFDQAAADLARGRAVQSGNPEYALLQVYALVQLGDVPGYRKVCAELLDAYEDTTNGWFGFLVAWTCAMAPDTLDDWSRAVALPKRFVFTDLTNQALHWNAWGLLHYRAGNLAEADKALRQAIARSPGWPARNELALALVHKRLGKDEEAEKWLDKSLAEAKVMEPGNLHASGFRDVLVYQQFLGEMAVLFPDVPLAKTPLLQALRHRALIHLGRWEEALAGLDKALDQDANDAVLYLERARCHDHLKQAGKAEADFAKALELKVQALAAARAAFAAGAKKSRDRDTLENACRDLAHLQERLGRPADALSTLTLLPETGAGDADRLFAAARDVAALLPGFGGDAKQAQRLKAADLAVATLKKMVDLEPLEVERFKEEEALRLLYGRADFQALAKEVAQRARFTPAEGTDLRWLGPALEKKPTDDQLRLERARLLARKGRWREAVDDYDLILKTAGKKYDYRLERARCHLMLGHWDQAAADFVAALDQWPADVGMVSPASLACREIAAWEPAFRKALELRPNLGLLWIGRARHHLLRSQWADAAAAYARGIDSQPFQEVWFEYAAAQYLAGDQDGYRKTVRKMQDFQARDPLNPTSAYILTRACSSVPDSGVDSVLVLKWANLGANNRNQGHHMHLYGAACYRADQMATALQHFEISTRAGWQHGQFLNAYFLAMVHHRLGNDDLAREWLARANRHMDRLAATFPGEGVAIYETDWVEAPLLRQEAERLLGAAQKQKGP